jgi:hypothetical protein
MTKSDPLEADAEIEREEEERGEVKPVNVTPEPGDVALPSDESPSSAVSARMPSEGMFRLLSPERQREIERTYRPQDRENGHNTRPGGLNPPRRVNQPEFV